MRRKRRRKALFSDDGKPSTAVFAYLCRRACALLTEFCFAKLAGLVSTAVLAFRRVRTRNFAQKFVRAVLRQGIWRNKFVRAVLRQGIWRRNSSAQFVGKEFGATNSSTQFCGREFCAEIRPRGFAAKYFSHFFVPPLDNFFEKIYNYLITSKAM